MEGAEARLKQTLVLASTSPQRRAILEQLQISFRVVPPTCEEVDTPERDAVDLVRTRAEGKARSVHRQGITLGVDTAVRLAGRMYGKPADAADARAMLRELSGRRHLVLSGLCLLGPDFALVAHEETQVTFRPLTELGLEAYLASGEWRERAGGYAIQGLGGRLVASIAGDYLNVVGLPGALLMTVLEHRAPELIWSSPLVGAGRRPGSGVGRR